MTVYAIGSTNDDLVRELRDPDPRTRATAAKTLGAVHGYLALPHLMTAARADPNDQAQGAARLAVGTLLPSREVVHRAVTGRLSNAGSPQENAEAHARAAAAVIDVFRGYVATRRSDRQGRPVHSDDVRAAAIDYIDAWGGVGVDDLDAVGLAAAQAIGAIARHIEIPPQHAGAKYCSYRDAQARVGAYDALLVDGHRGRS
jgi:hypothetical protein